MNRLWLNREMTSGNEWIFRDSMALTVCRLDKGYWGGSIPDFLTNLANQFLNYSSAELGELFIAAGVEIGEFVVV